MKKVIMMTTTMIAMGYAAQAGYFTWGMGSFDAGSGPAQNNHYLGADGQGLLGTTIGAGTTVYLILASDIPSILDAIDDGSFVDGMARAQGTMIANGSVPTSATLYDDVPGLSYALLLFEGLGYDGTPGATGNYVLSATFTINSPSLAPASPTSNTLGAGAASAWNNSTIATQGRGLDSYAVDDGGPTIPEPASALLALAGVGMLIRRRRRS